MKKFFMILMLLCCSQIFAAPFNRLVFFGDSLTDNGNLYQLALKIIPKSPPYYQGRFSNGPTWAEHVSKFFYDQEYMQSANYAVGGATAIFHLPTGNFAAPTNLGLEVDKYLIDNLFKDHSQTLFSVWIGGNDYLFDPNADIESVTTNVTNKITHDIERLISYGGKYFIVFNLPDLAKTPYAKNGFEEKLSMFSMIHNEKLAAGVKTLVDTYPNVAIIYVNIFDIFNDVISNPKKYNRKYHLNLQNVNEACWQGGYWFNKDLSYKGLESEIRQTIMTASTRYSKNVDYKSVNHFILNSPAMAEAYTVGKLYQEGVLPCENANEYLFWDHIHPTAVVHTILSKVVLDLLAAQIPS